MFSRFVTSRLLAIRDPRLCSGFLSAVTVGVITFVHLEPLFVKVDVELAEIAPYFLALLGAVVGMALGVLLPILAPGACLGAVLSILLCSLGMPCFNLVIPAFAVVGALIAAK